MGRYTDVEMIVMKEEVYSLRDLSLEAEGMAWHATQGLVGKPQGWSGARGARGKAGAPAFVMVPTGRKGGGWMSRVRIGWWSNFSGLWGRGAVPPLVLVLGWLGRKVLPRYMNRAEEVVQSVGSGLVSLCRRAICCPSAALGEAVTPQPGRPQVPEL